MKLVSLLCDDQSGNETEMTGPAVCFWADGDPICCFGTKITHFIFTFLHPWTLMSPSQSKLWLNQPGGRFGSNMSRRPNNDGRKKAITKAKMHGQELQGMASSPHSQPWIGAELIKNKVPLTEWKQRPQSLQLPLQGHSLCHFMCNMQAKFMQLWSDVLH